MRHPAFFDACNRRVEIQHGMYYNDGIHRERQG